MIKVADIVEEHKKGNVSKASMIKMAAFKAELEKTAIGMDFMKKMWANPNVQQATSIAAITGLGSLIHFGIQQMEHAWEKHQFNAEIEPQFQKVLESHPELAETEERETLARRYFEALHHFSPSMAASPIAAGAYIHQALEMHHVAGGPLPEMVEKATLLQKNLADIHDKQKSEYVTPLGAVFAQFKPQQLKYPDLKPMSAKEQFENMEAASKMLKLQRESEVRHPFLSPTP